MGQWDAWSDAHLAVNRDGKHGKLISPGQNGRHFSDGILKCIFMMEFFLISNQISLRVGVIDDKKALVRQAITWTKVWLAHRHIFAALREMG